MVGRAAQLLDEIALQVSAQLEALLQPPDAESSAIYEAMRYSVMAGGKRLRPALVILSARLVSATGPRPLAGPDADALAMPAACAIEMVHTYSLIHDDLPAMDNDDLRRGRPTSHKVFGEALAILAGDALLTEAFAVLAAPQNKIPPRRVVQLVQQLSSAAGAVGMVGGQVADLDAERNPASTVRVETIHERKTGRMILAAVNMGGLVAGADRRAAAALESYGRHLGLTFQIADDIIDAESTTAELGKTAGKDAASGKRTFVAVYGLEGARERAQVELLSAITALDRFGPPAENLRRLARFCVERKA